MTDEKKPFWAHCECGHKWVAAWTPMPMDRMGRLLISLRCPMCGAGPKNIFLEQNSPATA